MTILDEIIASKKLEIAKVEKHRPIVTLMQEMVELSPCRAFVAPFQGKADRLRVIAEVKKASPSAGVIREDFDPVAIAAAASRGGATALSVLTDTPYFKGELSFLSAIRHVVPLPLLRKDFIIDPYQIYESRLAGADAILLIAAVLSRGQLEEYLSLANELGLEALVEIHSLSEFAKIAHAKGRFVLGVNNRDLTTFEVSLDTSKALAALLDGYPLPLVSESGLSSRAVLLELVNCGFSGFLIGESLMREKNIEQALSALVNGP